MTTGHPAIETLTGLGLNRLEAAVYVHLLANPPMTAYRIARGIGAATANVYKAVESLANRGAVLVEDGANRLCRAVPAREFLRQIETGFLERGREAERALAAIERKIDDERWYKLDSVPAMLERARSMLAGCRSVAVVDAFPALLAALVPEIERAAERGVAVHVQAYAPVEIAGVAAAVPSMAARSLALWDGEQLNLAVDGRECIVALTEKDLSRVKQGIWSNSRYLSCIVLAGVKAEHTIHRMRAALGQKDESRCLKKILLEHGFLTGGGVPGQRELRTRKAGRSK